MDNLTGKLTVNINPSIYLKDPTSSDLGKKIIRKSIDLIDELGFEQFTFKKLAKAIHSTEASVYRYFQNKQQVLAYLTSWYWGWQEYRLMLALLNVEDPHERLCRAIRIVTEEIEEDSRFLQVNEVKLNRIVRTESGKTYFQKNIDETNKQGVFTNYKDLVHSIATIITEIKPNYKYPHMLMSTVIEGVHHQRYFAEHLPRLTDVIEGEDAVFEFCMDMILKTIE
ncbi:MAG: TetR/AcrR family transcriptional regulator [Crocinitomicaceae bacterium]|jgi:AcrR family transcriptional regulator|nr:TetR/AcrR family transcriptional regulator [Crocinitomicaceae bacterium]